VADLAGRNSERSLHGEAEPALAGRVGVMKGQHPAGIAGAQ
jgi:hypothetical protein